MAVWKNDEEMFLLMKEKLYTPVVGDILDQMGFVHQFLPAEIRPLSAMTPASYCTGSKKPAGKPFSLSGERSPSTTGIIFLRFPMTVSTERSPCPAGFSC